MKKLLYLAAFAALLSTSACSDEPEIDKPTIDPVETSALFVVNSGNLGYGNASLSVINPHGNFYVNNFFYDANQMLLGDVAQSMSMGGGKGWIVVNGSNVIFAIDPATGRELGRIDSGITSPRNFYYVDATTAYVTQLYDNRIAIVDPSQYKVTGYIEIPGMEASTGSTEEMVFDGQYAYANCWSYQRTIVKIDLAANKVIGSIDVGVQPCSIVMDANHILWALTDGGGWDGNPIGYEAPALVKINPSGMKVIGSLKMKLGDSASALIAADGGHTLYWLNNGVYRMDIDATELPLAPYISTTTYLNALTVSPVDGDIYVADAIDYVQAGVVRSYHGGVLTHSYTVGIIPTGFCWLVE